MGHTALQAAIHFVCFFGCRIRRNRADLHAVTETASRLLDEFGRLLRLAMAEKDLIGSRIHQQRTAIPFHHQLESHPIGTIEPISLSDDDCVGLRAIIGHQEIPAVSKSDDQQNQRYRYQYGNDNWRGPVLSHRRRSAHYSRRTSLVVAPACCNACW